MVKMEYINFLLEYYTQAMVAKLLGYSHRSSLTHILNSGVMPLHKVGIARLECEKIERGMIDFTKPMFAKDIVLIKGDKKESVKKVLIKKEKIKKIKCQKHRKTYKAWFNMRARCTDPDHASYNHYGGRGIKVCKEWMAYKKFAEDMGVSPEGSVLDRIDVNGNYCKSNCRWTDHVTSANNKRKKAKKILE